MQVFVDTNVVVAFLTASHPDHERVTVFFGNLMAADETIVISPQVVAESFRVMTYGRFFREKINAISFRQIIHNLLADPDVLLICHGESALEFALEAAISKNITSSGIYDMTHYGTMREHGITRLATFNEKHFRNLEGIELVPIP